MASLTAELAFGWLAKARGDLAIAEAGWGAPAVPAWPIAFHCQQAVEKCLKAFLVLSGVKPPNTHILCDLTGLADFARVAFPLAPEHLDSLQPFAVAERYPILLAPEASRADVAPLLESARLAVAWAEQLLAGAA